MRMSEKKISCYRLNLNFKWFFLKFLIFYNVYKIKLWMILIKLFFFDLNENEIFSKKKFIEKKNGNKVKKEFVVKEGVDLVFLNYIKNF